MKKIYLLLFVSIFTLSCTNNDDDNFDQVVNSDSGWVEVSSDGAQIVTPFSSYSVDVPIRLGIGNNEKGQQITYKVEQISGNPVADLKTGTFTYNLPSGDIFGKIPVEFINAPNYAIQVTLLSTNNGDYTIGLSDDSKRVSYRIGVCGDVEIASSYSADSSIDGNSVTIFDLEPVLVNGTDNVYTVESAWGPNFVASATGDRSYSGQFVYPATITINEDLSVTVESNAFYGTGGTGTFDPCTNTISYELGQTLFNGDFKVNVVATLP